MQKSLSCRIFFSDTKASKRVGARKADYSVVRGWEDLEAKLGAGEKGGGPCVGDWGRWRVREYDGGWEYHG